MVVVTSFKCGTLRIVTGLVASNVPAKIGSAAFLAPDMDILPDNVAPPSMRSLSNVYWPLLLLPLVRRERANRQSVNFIAHQRAQRLVYELMPCDGSKSLEFCCDNNSRIMGIVVTHDLDVSILEPGFNELAYVGWIHVSGSARIYSGARSVPVKNRASQRRALFVYDIRPRAALACRN